MTKTYVVHLIRGDSIKIWPHDERDLAISRITALLTAEPNLTVSEKLKLLPSNMWSVEFTLVAGEPVGIERELEEMKAERANLLEAVSSLRAELEAARSERSATRTQRS